MKIAIILTAFISGIVLSLAFAVWQQEPVHPTAAAELPLDLPRADLWTPESVSDDPLGFAEFAEKNVRKDLVFLEQSGAELERKRERARRALSKTKSFLVSAKERTADLRKAYQKAEAQSAFPVVVGTQVYDRETLIEETQTLLHLQASYAEIVPQFEEVIESIDESKLELDKNLISTNSVMPALERERQLLYNDQESIGSQSFLTGVEQLLDENEVLLGQANRPVPVVEDLLLQASNCLTGKPDKSSIINFLSKQ